MKKSVESSGAADLKELRSEFARVRAKQGGGRGVRYPEDLKQRAVLALQSGHPVEEVVEACGVPYKSIRRWMQMPQPVRELQIMPEREPQGGGQSETLTGNALIHLGDGRIRVEVPLAALNEELLSRLQMSVGGAA